MHQMRLLGVNIITPQKSASATICRCGRRDKHSSVLSLRAVQMKKKQLSILGANALIIGIPTLLVLSFVIYKALTYNGDYGPLPSYVIYLPVFLVLDIIMISLGCFMVRRFQEEQLFLTGIDGPIHSIEHLQGNYGPSIYYTSCGLVVSTDAESSETSHVGYRIIHAEKVTCRDCAIKLGSRVMEKSLRREY